MPIVNFGDGLRHCAISAASCVLLAGAYNATQLQLCPFLKKILLWEVESQYFRNLLRRHRLLQNVVGVSQSWRYGKFLEVLALSARQDQQPENISSVSNNLHLGARHSYRLDTIWWSASLSQG